ncbi:VOC family protein [Aurantiacibacter aquimixticola]|uniref:VOC family protein n=1 Tax=Aurantiacibacter aquimixticola TaxID=1958945 RepID=A0A419RW64_9SPHN|nr:VOC family protein [Aurantiacibacter aquimixticola]RJY10040.1 VOC family protein [Aurantiacibacter aquimixticola]
MSASASTEPVRPPTLPGRSLLGVAIGLFLSATPVSAQQENAADFGVEPWTDAVVSVADFHAVSVLFREAGDWRLVQSGEVDRGELDYWQLDGQVTARFERWCAPEADTGCLRLVRFAGTEQKPIRPAARAWDTGGIYSMMVRSDDIPALYEQALDLGWWAESPPIRFQFGTSDLRNVVLQGPHGINIAVYERVSPDFTAFPVGAISQGFNSMRMVRNREAARAFYTETLGFDILFDATSEPEQPAFSNFGIPFNLTPDVVRSATALHPVPGETGRIEVMQIMGFTGRDHAERASPPNLGHLSVRYPVRDMDGYRAFLAANGAEVAFAAPDVDVAGIGRVDIVAIRDSDGSLTEFYEIPAGEITR